MLVNVQFTKKKQIDSLIKEHGQPNLIEDHSATWYEGSRLLINDILDLMEKTKKIYYLSVERD